MTEQAPLRRPAPFSLRLTPEERLRLEHDAAGQPLGAYVKARLFDGAMPPRRNRGRTPLKDHQALSEVLGKLGQSRIANNLNQLAHAANLGTLDLTPEAHSSLQEAVTEIALIRRLLVAALGLAEDSP